MVNTQKLLNRALDGLDYVGFQLEEMGITDRVNRHNVMAFAFAEQKNLEGQIESLTAKVGTQKARIEKLRADAEKRIQNTVDFALTPVRFTRDQVKALIG